MRKSWLLCLRRGVYVAGIFSLNASVSLGATLSNCDEASLRQAISDGGTITFACDATITLSAPLIVERDIVLDGGGRQVTLSGGNAARVLEVNPGVNLSIRALTIANGAIVGTNGVAGAPGQEVFGAGILNRGNLTLVDCFLRSNVVTGGTGGPGDFTIPSSNGGDAHGASIENDGGVVWATNCIFVANSCIGGAGGAVVLNLPGGRGGDAFGGAFSSRMGAYGFFGCQFASNFVIGGQSGAPFSSGAGGTARGGAVASDNSTGAVAHTHFVSNRTKAGNVAWSGFSSEATGGAVFSSNGLFTAERCLFESNIAESGTVTRGGPKGPARGGAIANRGKVSLTGSYFTNNLALGMNSAGEGVHAFGGAVDNDGVMSITGCTFGSNTARGGDSTSVGFTGYPAGNAHGGGVYSSGTLTVTNSTFVANASRGGTPIGFIGGVAEGVAHGGAIGVISNAVLSHVTIASNVALNGVAPTTNRTSLPGRGGGIYAADSVLFLQNSLLAGNVIGSNAFGVLTDQGNNISSDASCQFTQPGSRNNVDPLLSLLADFGGPTPTMALLSGSPAIDAALPSLCVPTDQRGRPRPWGSDCDVGAFESSPSFTVRGTIHGFKPPQGIAVQCSGASGTTDAHGNYIVFGVDPGSHNLVPTSPDSVVIPNSRPLSVSSDILDIDFKAYRFNGLTIDEVSDQDQTVVLAGQSGDIFEVQTSQGLTGPWSILSTNTVGPNGIVTFQTPLNGASSYLRARRLAP